MKKKKIITIALIAAFSLCAVFTGMMAYWQWNDGQQSKDDFSALAELVAEEPAAPEQTPAPTDEPEAEPDERELAYEKYKALYEQNNDFVGWITIDGTAINYPVMQSIGSPDYYLKHNFEKAYSDYGVPYVDEACAVGLSANTVVYGHHMKNGTMFSSLVNYADKAYFDEHPVIRFDTIYGFGEYQVIAAFSFDTNNETFRYNEFADGNEAQFNEYVAECMARRAYDTGFTSEYGDKLLTLSTCEYTHTNGRFVVVTKLITE
jgi:sortase B